MKVDERQKAIRMRKQGVAMAEIARRLGVAKSSVSYWVRDVTLSRAQYDRLKANSHSFDAIEKRRTARLANTDQRRKLVKQNALRDIDKRITDPLWCIGVSLYWGEGGKTQQTARLSNSDPAVIRTMMCFFRDVCKIEESKFRGHIHTFSHSNTKKAEQYWSKVSGIPTEKFYKTYVKQSSASKQKRNTLPYGTFQIYVHDSDFFFTLMAWIEYLKNKETW